MGGAGLQNVSQSHCYCVLKDILNPEIQLYPEKSHPCTSHIKLHLKSYAVYTGILWVQITGDPKLRPKLAKN